jgi:tight adherence protein C
MGNQMFLPGVPMALLVSIFGAVVFLVLAASSMLSGTPGLERRLRIGEGARASGGVSLSYADKGSRSLFRRIERSLAPQDARKRSAIRQRLLQAGYYGPYAVTAYYALRVVLTLALPSSALLGATLALGALSIEAMYLLILATIAIAFFLPALYLRQRIAKRQQEVRDAFPDTLDLLLVCVEAGLGLNAALVRVAAELADAYRLLCEHLRLASLEMQAGASRDSALRNLGERIGIEEVSALVTLLMQSEAMGVSIAKTLRIYASEMRSKRLLRAEEHANKLPVRMVMPLGAMVLPAFMIVVCSPGIIRIVTALVPVLKG